MRRAGDAHETEVVGDDLPALPCISHGEGAIRSHFEQPPIRTARPFRFSAERRPVGARAPLESAEAVHTSRIGRSQLPLEAWRYAFLVGAKCFACGIVVATALSSAAALPAASGAVGATALTLDVTFSANNTIAVTLPDGTSVGTASGAPSAIPAGYYTVVLTGPMGLPSGLPYFHLSGPAVDLLSNLNEGGLETDTEHATLQPSSLYTWTDDALPGIAYRFTTTANIAGRRAGSRGVAEEREAGGIAGHRGLRRRSDCAGR